MCRAMASPRWFRSIGTVQPALQRPRSFQGSEEGGQDACIFRATHVTRHVICATSFFTVPAVSSNQCHKSPAAALFCMQVSCRCTIKNHVGDTVSHVPQAPKRDLAMAWILGRQMGGVRFALRWVKRLGRFLRLLQGPSLSPTADSPCPPPTWGKLPQ